MIEDFVNKPVTITDITAIIGVIFGLSGLILGIINYIRDRTNIAVTLKWDMKSFGDTGLDETKNWGVVTVTNSGRRPVYISHIALKLPRKYKDYSHLLLRDGIAGQKLTEGDAPATFMIDQNGLDKYGKDWKKIRAEVSMSTGKKKLSRRVIRKPSWA